METLSGPNVHCRPLNTALILCQLLFSPVYEL